MPLPDDFQIEEALEKIREERRQQAARTISNDCPNPTKLLRQAILTGNMTGPWRDAALIPALQKAAEENAKAEAEEIVAAPEATF